MSTRYDPSRELWRDYRPQRAPLHCRATTRAAARRWQLRTRPRLVELLGFATQAVAPRPRLRWRRERADHVLESHELTVARDVVMPYFLVHPRGSGRSLRRPLVVACHGHGAGAREIVGLNAAGDERTGPAGYQDDFALQLCRRGFVVAVPEIAGFGERQHDVSALAKSGSPVPSSCAHLATLAWHQGGSLVGMRVRDTRRLLDHLLGLPGIDARRAGIMGISGGGMLALFSAAVDTRLRAAVISGYFSTFQHSILGISHCWCNFVPGLGAFGEMHDLAALVAPRPLLIESGRQDTIFPVAAVRAGLTQARRHYAVHGASGALHRHLFAGDHRIDGARAYPFLTRHLA